MYLSRSEKETASLKRFLKCRASQSQVIASGSSSGRGIVEGADVEESRRKRPSANLGLSNAASTGEAKLRNREDTQSDTFVFPSPISKITSPAEPASLGCEIGCMVGSNEGM